MGLPPLGRTTSKASHDARSESLVVVDVAPTVGAIAAEAAGRAVAQGAYRSGGGRGHWDPEVLSACSSHYGEDDGMAEVEAALAEPSAGDGDATSGLRGAAAASDELEAALLLDEAVQEISLAHAIAARHDGDAATAAIAAAAAPPAPQARSPPGAEATAADVIADAVDALGAASSPSAVSSADDAASDAAEVLLVGDDADTVVPDVDEAADELYDFNASAALVGAVEGENWEEASRLLRDGAACDPNARTSDWGYCLLRAAAEEGARETCRQLVLKGADPNSRDPNGMTPLMGCVVGGDFPDIVEMLLAARADPSASTDDGFTALSWATRLNRDGVAQVLREAGAEGPITCF